VASALPGSRLRILPVLAAQLESCNPRDLPTHAESILPAVDGASRGTFVAILAGRTHELTQPQAARLRLVLRGLDSGE
jgi:hypothetical protein